MEHQTLTRAEAAALDVAGLLDGACFELIDGALIDTRGKSWRHVKVTKAAGHALAEVFGWDFVQQASPIDVAPEDRARNEPEPDVTVLRRTFLDFDDTPAPADVALAVEVADTSLWPDLVTKCIAIRARASSASASTSATRIPLRRSRSRMPQLRSGRCCRSRMVRY